MQNSLLLFLKTQSFKKVMMSLSWKRSILRNIWDISFHEKPNFEARENINLVIYFLYLVDEDFASSSSVNDETEDSLGRCDLFSRSHIEIDVTIEMCIIIEKKLARRNHCKNIYFSFTFGILVKYGQINFIFQYSLYSSLRWN